MNPNNTQPGCPNCQMRGVNGTHVAGCPFDPLQWQTQQNTVNFPNYTWGSTGSSGIAPGGVFSGYAQTAYTATDTICALCGEKFTLKLFAQPPFPLLCEDCEVAAKKKIIAICVPEGSKVHCPRCHYHVNACSCDEAVKMKELEK